jgi:glutathione S-transferase
MKMQLYYAPVTCSLAPFITLTEANAEFEVMPVNMRKGQNKSPEYMKLNPKHKVPLLVVDGKPLTENVAIQLWIARTYPWARLLPADPWQEVQAVSILSWCASGIHPYLSRINNPAKVCDAPGSAESVHRFAAEIVYECIDMAEDLLAGREYFFDHFTAPDAHFFWCFRRAGQFKLELARFKNCAAHFERMHTRPSVQKLLALEKDVQAQFAAAA